VYNVIQCCGSGMFIPDPDFCPSLIPDLWSRIHKNSKRRYEWKINLLFYLFCSHNITKFKIILVLNWWRKKFGRIYKDLHNFLPQKLSLSSQKYGFEIRDPWPEIRDPEKTYSVSEIQGSKRHRIPDPQHWRNITTLYGIPT
jgi:hypothetical protein